MNQKYNPIFDLLRADAHISVNKALAHAIGFDEAAIYAELLSRQAYFYERGEIDPDGYFYNTIYDLRSGTTLTDYQQRRAIANLTKIGLIDAKVQGLPPKRFFKVVNDLNLISELLQKGKEEARRIRQNANFQETSKFNIKKLHINNNTTQGSSELTPEQEAQFRELQGDVNLRVTLKPNHFGYGLVKPSKKRNGKRVW